MEIARYLILGIGIVGIAVISWGVIASLVELIRLELKRIKGVNICFQREVLRHHLGSSLLLGLELLVSADIIQTIVKPTLDDVLILTFVVIIRTILDIFLNKELGTHSCSQE